MERCFTLRRPILEAFGWHKYLITRVGHWLIRTYPDLAPIEPPPIWLCRTLLYVLPSLSSISYISFLPQSAIVGSRVTLPCRVENKAGILQWTKDDFGLGTQRNLTGYERYSMIGSDEEGRYCLLVIRELVWFNITYYPY